MSKFLDEGRAPVVIDVDYHTPSDKRIPVTLSGLSITLSGSDIQIGAVELKNAISDIRAFVGTPTDDFDENGLATIAHVMAYEPGGGEWERVRAVFTDLDDVEEDSINPALAVGAVILGLDEADQFDRIRGTSEYGLETDVTRIQGTAAISGVIAVSEIIAPFTISGDVTILGTTAVSGIVNIDSMPEVVLTPGTIAVSGEVVIIPGTTISRNYISASDSVNLIASGAPESRVCVLSVLLIASGVTNAAFHNGSTGTSPLTGELTLDAGGAGFVLNAPASREMYHFETGYEEDLYLTLAPITYVGGFITYYIRHVPL